MSYNSTCDENDYYAILGVPYTADYKAIRKAYLKLSLQYHPDKNTNNHPEQAQAAFVRIGRAYQTLSDPTERRVYDLTYRPTTGRPSSRPSPSSSSAPQYTKQSSFAKDFYESSDSSYDHQTSSSSNTPNGNTSQQYQQQQQYETYREYFDNTMGDLSEDEMKEVMGAAAVFSSIIGGIIGAKLFGGSVAKGGTTSAMNPALSAVGSAIGSALASQAATTMLQNSRAQAKQRALKNADPSRQEQREPYLPPRDHSPRSSGTVKSDCNERQQPHWKDIVENVMTGPIAQEAGKVVQQVVNDFINGSHKSKK